MITITLKFIQTIKDEIETIDFFQTKMNLIVKVKDKKCVCVCFLNVKEYVKNFFDPIKKMLNKVFIYQIWWKKNRQPWSTWSTEML